MKKAGAALLICAILLGCCQIGLATNRYSLTREEMDAITNPVDALRDSGASYDEWYTAGREAREALAEANKGPRNYGDVGGQFTKALNRTYNWGGFAEGTYLLPQYMLGSGPSWVASHDPTIEAGILQIVAWSLLKDMGWTMEEINAFDLQEVLGEKVGWTDMLQSNLKAALGNAEKPSISSKCVDSNCNCACNGGSSSCICSACSCGC